MTLDDRVRALMSQGFTPGQAAFLTRVLLHSGYFLRRQHCEFLGIVRGAYTADFVRRLLDRQFATQEAYWRCTHLYHVSAPSLYAAIGEGGSRRRRPAEPAAITRKLMTLDVVIAHPDDEFLATESEKVAFFTEQCGVPLAELPAKIYTSAHPSGGWTARYFVDRVPIQRTAGSDRVTFVYVPGWSTLDAFAAFLRDYDALFRRLGQSRIRFCSTSADMGRKARGLCYRMYQPTGLAMNPALMRRGDPVVRRDALLHFEARRRFESRAFHTFSQGDLDRLREDLQRFSGDWWDAWYQRWCVDGDKAVAPSAPSPSEPPRTSPIEFVEERLPHSYPLFGGIDDVG
jgi:hypothetical protein